MKIFYKNSIATNIFKFLPILIIVFCLILTPTISVHGQECDKDGKPVGCTPIKTDTNTTPIKTDTNVTPSTKKFRNA
jgi:hypothetical protein